VAHTSPIRILSVEDHPVFRQGLATVIDGEPDMVLVAQAANGVEAIAEFRRHRPDVTLMDLRLPGINGTDILIAISRRVPQRTDHHAFLVGYRRRDSSGAAIGRGWRHAREHAAGRPVLASSRWPQRNPERMIAHAVTIAVRRGLLGF
jgi:CheY-like chemotaxis protein